MQLDFLNKTRRKISEKFFLPSLAAGEKIIRSKIAKKIVEKFGVGGPDIQHLKISLTLIHDREMAPLHEKWRGKKGPTDVLAFSFFEGDDAKIFKNAPEKNFHAGDIIISVDTIARQAKKHKRSFSEELRIMFVHGFLHIFGFDHETDAEEAEMERYAQKIMFRGASSRIGYFRRSADIF